MKNKSIGIFDSGLGGLSVLRHITNILPFENIVYFGDTARMPYGTKSGQVIERYAIENAAFLMTKEIKALVVACNTASCFSLNSLQQAFSIPVIEMIHPTIEAIKKKSHMKKIAILGTQATIDSGVYQKFLPLIEIIPIAAPLLVHLVEEEYLNHPFVSLMIQEYLRPLKTNPVEALVLACTHFPLLSEQIQKELFFQTQLIDPGLYCAYALKEVLTSHDLLHDSQNPPLYRFYVSDAADKFEQLSKKFLKNSFSQAFTAELAVL